MKSNLPKRGIWSYALGGVLVAVSLAFAAIMVFVSSSRDLSPLESSLFQAVILGGGLSGSFLFGRMSSLQTARDMIRPHARSAFRRVLSLHRSLYKLSVRIETLQEEGGGDHRLEIVRAVVDEQIVAGGDAMEDWRDIIEDDIDEILERYGRRDDAR